MGNDRLLVSLREICQAPGPERKKEFFQHLEKQGLLSRRPVTVSHGEFLLGQLPYIEKWVWLLSCAVLLLIIGICSSNPDRSSAFALTPFLAAGIFVETRRSFRWKMAELEYSARYSLRSIMLARLFLVGTVDTAGLLLVILAVRAWLSYSLIRVFLYMIVPYLCASLLGSVYERKHRADRGCGSIVICFLSSAFFAAAPLCSSILYEEKMTVLWAVAFVLLVCGLIVNMQKWAYAMEEPVWSS